MTGKLCIDLRYDAKGSKKDESNLRSVGLAMQEYLSQLEQRRLATDSFFMHGVPAATNTPLVWMSLRPTTPGVTQEIMDMAKTQNVHAYFS